MKEWQSLAHVRWECKYPHCVRSEVPQEGSVRTDAQANRANPVAAVQAKGCGNPGGICDARPHPSGVEDPTEVQRGTGGGISERQIHDPDSSGVLGCEAGFHRKALLVAGILCEHGWTE